MNQEDAESGRVRHSLESVTIPVEATRVLGHPSFGDRIILLDTPGFDDTYKPDKKILEEISGWLKKM